jgi:signal transduction histidine kinase
VSGSALDESRLHALLEVGRSLVTELDREALFHRVLVVARELTGARYAALGILDKDSQELERFVVSGIDDETHRAIGDLPRGRGILGELIRNPAPLCLDDISKHPRSYGFPPAHPPMTTFLGAPIMLRGEVWGNLYLTEKEGGHPFDGADEESLVILADWTAIAVHNARLYESVEARRDELERAVQGLGATTAIARAVGGETDLGRVLELVVKRGRALVDARSMLILLRDEDDLSVAAAAGESHEGVVGARIPGDQTIAKDVLESGRVERLADAKGRLRLGLEAVAPDAHTAMLVPLTFRAQPLGVLVALDRVGGAPGFLAKDERLLRAFAASAATAVATAQIVEAEQLRRSVKATEDERARWARELHDETLQGLGALQMLLESALRRSTPEAVRAAAVQAVTQVEGDIEKLLAIITELRPASLDALGVQPALESLVKQVRTVHGLEVDLRLDLAYEAGRTATRPTPDIEAAIYRIVQEALTNVARHAKAEHVWVSVVEYDERLRIELRDDGRGLKRSAETPGSGFGLIGMRERVDLVGGSFSIESAPGEGTTVRAEIPSVRREETERRMPRSA